MYDVTAPSTRKVRGSRVSAYRRPAPARRAGGLGSTEADSKTVQKHMFLGLAKNIEKRCYLHHL